MASSMMKKVKKVFRRLFKQYAVLKVISLILVAYIAAWSYAPVGTFGSTGGFVDPDVGFVIDPNSEERTEQGIILTKGTLRAIVAANNFQMVCLGITRASAFFMYPALVFIFITKFRATMEFISHTPFSMFTYQDLHELHVYCGWVILIDGVIHTCFHIARWSNQGNMNLMFDHFSGVSGFVIIICTLGICVPMAFASVRKKVSYESRKLMHYLFVPFCLALSFHSPTSTIPNGGFSPIIFPILIIWYVLDYFYVHLFMTEKISSTVFHVVPTGVQLTMAVSERFQRRSAGGGYCYVNFPWIDKTQWHAFSLFENPANPAERQIYIQDLGDWTHEVRMALQRDTSRPIWVQGPFSSPYDSAEDFDNQILVAGGIGITPALSVMRAHKDTRRSNLIWAVRDPYMLEFFLQHAEFSTRGWNLIFYTGKTPLHIGSVNHIVTASGATVHIIRERPNFDALLPNIIYGIESGWHVPESFVVDSKLDVIDELKAILRDLDQEEGMTTQEKLNVLISHAEAHGFLFTDIVAEISKDLQTVVEKAIAVPRGGNDEEAKEEKSGESEPMLSAEEDSGHAILQQIRTSASSSAEYGRSSTNTSADDSRGSSGYVIPMLPPRHDISGEYTMRPANLRLRKSVGPEGSTHGGQKSGLPSRVSLGNGVSTVGGRTSRMSVGTLAWTAIGNEMGDYMEEGIGEGMRFKPWKDSVCETATVKEFVKSLDQESVLSTWGVLYCGGQSPLAVATRKSSKEYGISLAMESFAW